MHANKVFFGVLVLYFAFRTYFNHDALRATGGRFIARYSLGPEISLFTLCGCVCWNASCYFLLGFRSNSMATPSFSIIHYSAGIFELAILEKDNSSEFYLFGVVFIELHFFIFIFSCICSIESGNVKESYSTHEQRVSRC